MLYRRVERKAMMTWLHKNVFSEDLRKKGWVEMWERNRRLGLRQLLSQQNLWINTCIKSALKWGISLFFLSLFVVAERMSLEDKKYTLKCRTKYALIDVCVQLCLFLSTFKRILFHSIFDLIRLVSMKNVPLYRSHVLKSEKSEIQILKKSGKSCSKSGFLKYGSSGVNTWEWNVSVHRFEITISRQREKEAVRIWHILKISFEISLHCSKLSLFSWGCFLEYLYA